jgi:hypothetical protein
MHLHRATRSSHFGYLIAQYPGYRTWTLINLSETYVNYTQELTKEDNVYTLRLEPLANPFPALPCPVIGIIYSDLSAFLLEKVQHHLLTSFSYTRPELSSLRRFFSFDNDLQF